MIDWHLECSKCPARASAEGMQTVCPDCGKPWLVRYPDRTHPVAEKQAPGGVGMWRFRSFLPVGDGESPVTLGEGETPLLAVPRLGAALGIERLWIKDEGTNPTGSFKSRGLAAAITRAVAAGARAFTLPTAGNAGVAAAAYGARAGAAVRVYAPKTTPQPILTQIAAFGADLHLLDGHIGDCGKASRAYAAESGALDLSTLREPYRIEGKKTMGLELADQFDWELPEVILYPTGGGTGLIGMWKVFGELAAAGWIGRKMPRMFTVQADGCAPVVRAFQSGAAECQPWDNPWTVASGLRVPGPLGDRLMLTALRESRGGAIAVTDEQLSEAAALGTRTEGIDCSPEGGAGLVAARLLREQGTIAASDRVVVFNTGAGWLYR